MIAHLDRRRVAAHAINASKYPLPTDGDGFTDQLVSRAEAKFAALLPWLVKEAGGITSVLDIGCGLALMDVLLWQTMGSGYPRIFHLLDGDGTQAPRDGFHQDTEAWADVNLGVKMLMANCGSSIKVFGHHASPSLVIEPVDLIWSFRAWGHHFPISVYIELVKRSLKRGGLVITDIRLGTDGVDVMQANGFKVVGNKIDDTSKKCQRLVFTHR